MPKSKPKTRISRKIPMPRTVEELRTVILGSYESYSKRLKQVAQYILDNPNDMALETLAVISERIGVQPSTIVRFAKALGYDGTSQIQKLYRDELISGRNVLGYEERIRKFHQNTSSNTTSNPDKLMSEIADGGILALEHLRETVSDVDLANAIKIIKNAECLYIVGFLRSFPVAAYLSYTFQRLNKNTIFIDGVAGLHKQQIMYATEKDAMIATSFKPYSKETRDLLNLAKQQRSKIIGISDSEVSPVASISDVAFKVNDASIRKFCSLTATMALAQALALGYAFDSER